MYICELSKEEQNKIEKQIKEFLIANGTYAKEELELVMNSKVEDINYILKEIKEMKKEKIIEMLEQMEDEEIIYVWNNYVDAINDYERHIYFMWELNDICCGINATELLDKIDEMNTCDDYFVDGIYGLKSLSNAYDEMDDDELADYIIDNIDDFDDFKEE